MNQSDDDKGAKKKLTQLSGDLNATHLTLATKRQVETLSQKVQKTMQSATSISRNIDKKALTKLDVEFPNLINDTNKLAEQVKKLSNIKVIPYEERYKVANKKVVLLFLRPDLDKIIRAKNKKFFLAFEKALDTSIIDAYPHEATLFKAGVLYKLYNPDDPDGLDPSPRVVEMSIALREDNFPDRFKYIEEEGKSRAARWMELAKQAYDEILRDPNLDTQQRFTASYEKFKKVYLGLRNSKQVNVEDIPDNAIILPEVPDTLSKNSLSHADEILFFKPSTRTYVNFTGDELSTFHDLIPEHSTEFFIPAIGGISLDEFMRTCLSRQKHIKDTKGQEMRKRTAAIQFLFKVQEVVHEAHRSLQEDMVGKLFDAHQGYVSWKAQPENLYAEISKLFQHNQKEQLITEDCHLSGPELTEKFFAKVFAKLDLDVKEEIKKIDYIKKKSKSKYEQKKKQIIENYPPRITMQDFKKIVEKVGAEHIKIFSAEADGKASYSVSKNSLINEATPNTGPVTDPTKSGRRG